jgi:tetratricopeptide (TPR) repeat protein
MRRFVLYCGPLLSACLMSMYGSQVRAQTGALELTSRLGTKLYAMPDDEAELKAKASVAADPHNVALLLMLSKAQAARRQYKEAVATDTAGLAIDPKNADLLLERGHRELGLRQFAAARKDLEQAAKINSTMPDVFYHLALSHYFVGEFAEAAQAFARCRELAPDMDSVIDDTNWLYASLRRAGKDAEAAEALKAVGPQVTASGHPAIYLRLVHLYQGRLGPDESQSPRPAKGDAEADLMFTTTSYGTGNWYLFEKHDASKAKPIFASVVEGASWNAWGFIGSEVELVRMNG